MEWTKYTTKEALKDNDELMILDKDANANKRTLMDKIWDYVVDKMTTAVIAKLGTTNKTLIGAVNELNSKRIRQFKIRGVYDNSTKTMTFSISQLKELHGLVLFKTVLSNGGRHLRLSLTSWNETVISQHTQNMITEPAATGNMESGSYKLEYRNNNFPTDMSGNCIIFLISDEG
nr:hypothetical protein [Mediterraneibacter faecis]